MIELLFTTGNPAKLAQLCFVAETLHAPVKVMSARQIYGAAALYTETGSTAAVIARDGALSVANRIGRPVVTEDTTLHVEALNGEPGTAAGQYLREHGRDGLLQALSGVTKRAASITSAVAWASPSGDTQTWTATISGEIAPIERWKRGLPDWIAPTPESPEGGGYNAVFVPTGSKCTLAQIPLNESFAWGYREPNFCALLAFILERQPA
jgi:non-canonical purine NTP pyrophosphatase (RdgB/HAM1 family)